MMENDDNEGLSPISKELVELMSKNLHDELGCNNRESITFSASSLTEAEKSKKLDNYSSVGLIKEEGDDLDDVFIENRTSNSSIIKIEPEGNVFENELFLRKANKDSDLDKFTNLYTIEEWKFKNEEVDVKEEELEQTETRFSSLSTFENWKLKNEEVDIKEEELEQTETRFTNLCTFKEWKLKNEEVDIKEEALEETETRFSNLSTFENCKLKSGAVDIKEEKLEKTETRMLVRCIRQEKHKDNSIKNSHQEMQKRKLNKHPTHHRKLGDMFKGDRCNFKTLHKGNLKMHALRHKNPEDVDIFKCDQCNFQTLYKGSLKTHVLRHKNPEDIDMFKCDQCNFKTLRKDHLKMHVLRHKNPEDIDMFKCDQCNFKTLQKGNLKTHVLRHKNPDKRCKGNYDCRRCEN